MIDPKEHPHLPVTQGNHLVIAKPSETHRPEDANPDDRWYDELTPQGQKVASYHVWQQAEDSAETSLKTGWTKKDAEGQTIDEGMLIAP